MTNTALMTNLDTTDTEVAYRAHALAQMAEYAARARELEQELADEQ